VAANRFLLTGFMPDLTSLVGQVSLRLFDFSDPFKAPILIGGVTGSGGNQAIAPIPLPASGGLFFTAFVLLWVAARRHRQLRWKPQAA
jgi:hypothetical protein